MTGQGDADLDELRREAVERHGLDPGTAQFLSATSVDEIETEAGQLAQLLGPEPEPEQAGPLAGLFAEKRRREHGLAMLLTGRAQPRDRQGRFAPRASARSIDGGARTSPPLPPPSHDEWLAHILSRHRTGAW